MRCILIVLVTLIGMSFQMSTTPQHTTGSNHHHTTHEPNEHMSTTPHHTTGSNHHHTTHEPNEQVRVTFTYDSHTQQMVIHQGHNCYVFALSAEEKTNVHTDAGMAQLEAKLLPMIFAGNMTHVDHRTADVHVKRLCGTSQIYLVA